MAMINCGECGAECSKSALVCPQCGFLGREATVYRMFARIGVGMVALWVLAIIIYAVGFIIDGGVS